MVTLRDPVGKQLLVMGKYIDPPPEYVSTEGRRPKWIPFTIRPTFLCLFFLATIAMIGSIEFLCQKSQQNDGLIFSDPYGYFTSSQTFCTQYLLTIISVFYGMGATAENSLLLTYPFDFMAFVPVTAAKRKHWSVFCSGIALVLIFWVITPLHSALFVMGVISKTTPMEFVHTAELYPFEQQVSNGNLQFLYDSYGITFLSQKLLPFTTKEYAAIPFKPASGELASISNGSMTAVTRTYSTNLDCIPGKLAGPGFQGTWQWGIDNGGGVECEQTFDHLTGISRSMNWMNIRTLTMCPNYLDTWVGWLIEEHDGVPGNWNGTDPMGPIDTPPPFGNATSISCRTRYSYVDRLITADTEGAIYDEGPIGDPVYFKQNDSIIDFRSFQQLVRIASDSWNTDVMGLNSDNYGFKGDYNSATSSKLGDLGLANLQNSQSALVGYAIELSRSMSIDDFKDPQTLAKAFQAVHQLLFANFVASSLLRNIPEEDVGKTKPISGTNIKYYSTVFVNLVIARLLQAFLSVVAVCFAILAILSYRRKVNLFGDPDSLAAKMALVAYSKSLLRDFEGLDEYSELGKHMKDRVYRLGDWGSNGSYRIDSEEGLTGDDTHSLGGDSDTQRLSYEASKISMPLALRTNVGVTFCLFLAFILGFLIFLYKSAEKNSGLPVVSINHTFVDQIIYAFIPTVLATLMEPFWVLVTRYFCVYQPYTELFKGMASPITSIGLKYTNIPPALVLFRALRTRHLVLFVLATTALLANLLAVSLGSLFHADRRQYSIPDSLTQSYTALIHPQIYFNSAKYPVAVAGGKPGINSSFAVNDVEHFIVATTNITRGTLLPAWVSKDYYFQPFESNVMKYSWSSHKAITRGFGGTVDCQTFENPILQPAVHFNSTHDYWNMAVNITLPTSDGRKILCGSPDPGWSTPPLAPDYKPYVPGTVLSGQYAFQMSPLLEEQQDLAANETCGSALIIGWARTVATDELATGGLIATDHRFKNIALVCLPKLKTAMFEVTVDEDNLVQDYHLVGPEEDLTGFLQDTTTGNFTQQMSFFLQSYGSNAGLGGGVLYLQNDSSSHEFPHYLTEKLLGISLSDPDQPLANFDTLSGAYTELCQRLFAIIFGLNAQKIFVKETSKKTVEGISSTIIQRVLINKTMFIITITILSMNIIVAAIFLLFRPKNILPRFPDTLASEIAFFYASQALQDVGGTGAMSSNTRKRHLESLGHHYGYGYFIGKDGKKHKGVERSSLLC